MNNMRRILKQPVGKPTLRLQDGGGLAAQAFGPGYSSLGGSTPAVQGAFSSFMTARNEANNGPGSTLALANEAANNTQSDRINGEEAARKAQFNAQAGAGSVTAPSTAQPAVAPSAPNAWGWSTPSPVAAPTQPYATATPLHARTLRTSRGFGGEHTTLRMADGGMFDGLRAGVNRLVGNNADAMTARGRTEEEAKPVPPAAPKIGPGGGPITPQNPNGLRFRNGGELRMANGGGLPALDSYGNPFDPEKTEGLSLGDAIQHSRLTGNMLIPTGTGTYGVRKPSTSAFFNGGGLPGMANGGDLRTGQGGHVPGSGKGDKIPAKYEPGEFVVSNDMLDAAPGLRDQLHDLRGNVLAKKGMTPEQADAKAVGGGGLRALFGYGDDEPFFSEGGLTPYATNSGFGNSVRAQPEPPERDPAPAAPSEYARQMGEVANFLGMNGSLRNVLHDGTKALVSYPGSGLNKAAAPGNAQAATPLVTPVAQANPTDRRLANGTQAAAPAVEAAEPATLRNPNEVMTLRQPNGVMSFSGKDIGQKPGDLSYSGDDFGSKGYGVSTIGAPGDGRRVMAMDNRLADGMRAEREAADAAAGAGQAAMGRAALAAQDRWDRKNEVTGANARFEDAGRRAAIANIAAIDARSLEATKEGGANGRAKMQADVASADRRANTAVSLRGHELTYQAHNEKNAIDTEIARRKAVSDERDYKAKREDAAAKREADEASGELATAKDKRDAVKAFDERISGLVTDRETGKPDEKAAAVIRNGANAFLANKQVEVAAALKKNPNDARAQAVQEELDKGLAGIDEATLRTFVLGQKANATAKEYDGIMPWSGTGKPTDTPISELRLKKGWLFDDYESDAGSGKQLIPARALRDRPDLQRLVR